MMGTPTTRYALVRGVPDTYDECIRTGTEPIDVELAKQQHRKYCEALVSSGLELITVDPDDRFPDCCFAEDPAFVVGDVAFISRMGAESRRGEEEEIGKILCKYKEIKKVECPGTIEGGDVLKIDDRIFIGISQRTNLDAFEQIKRHLSPLGYDVLSVKAKDLVHLKSDCAYIGEGCVVVHPGGFDAGVFDGYNTLIVPDEEAYAANCLALEGRVLVSDGYPQTRRLIEEADFATIPIEMSEFRKGEGALTCLSILF